MPEGCVRVYMCLAPQSLIVLRLQAHKTHAALETGNSPRTAEIPCLLGQVMMYFHVRVVIVARRSS